MIKDKYLIEKKPLYYENMHIQIEIKYMYCNLVTISNNFKAPKTLWSTWYDDCIMAETPCFNFIFIYPNLN